jgi:hypothetical protein
VNDTGIKLKSFFSDQLTSDGITPLSQVLLNNGYIENNTWTDGPGINLTFSLLGGRICPEKSTKKA